MLQVQILKPSHVDQTFGAVRVQKRVANDPRRIHAIVYVDLVLGFNVEKEEQHNDGYENYHGNQASSLALVGPTHSPVHPQDIVRALSLREADGLFTNLDLAVFKCLLLCFTFLKSKVKGVGDHQFVVFLVFKRCQLVFNLLNLVELLAAQILIPQPQQLEHLSVVEGESDVRDFAFSRA